MLILKHNMLLRTLTAVTEITVKLLKFHGSNTLRTPLLLNVSQSLRALISLASFVHGLHGSPSSGYPERMWSVPLQEPEPKNFHCRLEPRVWRAPACTRTSRDRDLDRKTYQGSHVTCLCKCLCLHPHQACSLPLKLRHSFVKKLS